MKSTVVFLIIVLLVTGTACAASASPSPKMRPYSGIGVLVLQGMNSESEPLYLYEEPGLSRQDRLNPEKLFGNNWIFGAPSSSLPLIVMGRKGAWLRVVYDDAGREAWLNPDRSGGFQTWEHYFKSTFASVLPGLQKKYLQLYQKPGGTVLASAMPRQFFKVLRIDNDWAMIMTDQNSLAWLRWRDEDGRLLIGTSTLPAVAQP